MIAASGIFLLRDLIYLAVIRIVSHFLSRPFAFGHLFQVFLFIAPKRTSEVLPSPPTCKAETERPIYGRPVSSTQVSQRGSD